MMDNLWYISLAECKSKLLACENYGYGLDLRRIKKGLKVIESTVQKHKESWEFWKELYCYKLLRDEGFHPPIYVVKPQWEQDIQYAFWRAYFSYPYQGAKTDRKTIYKE